MQKISKKQKVFAGEDAVREFLTPGALGFTPVVELPKKLNPYHKDRVRIFIKLLQFVPLGNIKSFPSHAMLSSVPRKELRKIKNLVEYSSGNTAVSLAVLAQHFGIPNTCAIVTPSIPEHKKRLLQLVGANLLVTYGPPTPGVHDDEGGIHDAKMLGKKSGWLHFNQYVNEVCLDASAEYVGKEIWKQFGADLSVFMASLGTAGTVAGAGKYLKNKIPGVHILGTATKEGSSVPGPRGEEAIHKLGFSWQNVVDEIVPMKGEKSFKASLDLIRLGLFVGPSTGMQLAALLKKLKEYKKKGSLKNLRNSDGEIVTCFLACDTMFPYIDDYFTNLPPNLFPKMKDL